MDVREGNWDFDDYLGPSKITMDSQNWNYFRWEKYKSLYFNVTYMFFLGDKYNSIYTVFLKFEKPEPVIYINALVTSTYWAIHS